jgi:ElaB/YqjD/DUF883 family membrane-anchored ribosome-binding protein
MPTTSNATNPTPKNGPAANRNRPSEPEDLAYQIEDIRAEIQNLTASIRAAASNQLDQVQVKAQDSIRQNPFTAVAIGAALGFLYGVLRR